MQARAPDVVGDAHLAADPRQLVQRTRLGRSRVDGRQEAHGTPGGDVPAQPLQQRADAAEAHERHHDVDPVGRVDLGRDLATHVRLAGRVGQQRGVEQRRERLADALRATVRQHPGDGVQHARIGRDGVPGALARPARAFDLVDDAVRERQAPLDAHGLGQRLDRPRQAAREVQREPVAGLLAPQRPSLGAQRAVEPGDARLERLCDERLVQATGEFGHGRESVGSGSSRPTPNELVRLALREAWTP